ncbi:hypothetical protein Nepgr_017836 [Nepenthes gracilis]|uniref:Uncharacterized protein n=1 Tax=Nepenthes gracilis TaxID=150966 RepID=A0AAD3SQ50_NEPGR|nr:hypothetical protein Nepgr_017836 [Nepenthes gracilis]
MSTASGSMPAPQRSHFPATFQIRVSHLSVSLHPKSTTRTSHTERSHRFPTVMAGSDGARSLSSPSLIKYLTTKSSSPGNNENEEENECVGNQNPIVLIGSKFQIENKPAIKSFMAPTISAASKAVNPRKKILSESKIDAFGFNSSDAHHHKSPNLDPKSNSKQVGISGSGKFSSHVPLSSSSFRVSESDDDGENSFVPDSSVRPYDPWTNYLSPRPKFLMYKPNRRRKIFLDRENMTGGGIDRLSPISTASFSSKKGIDIDELSIFAAGSSDSSSQGRLLKQGKMGSENPEEGDSGKEEVVIGEEVEEERDCGLKWLFKPLIVLAVLVLSTAYIFSMNSPTPPPALQIMRGLRNEYLKMEDIIFKAISSKNFEGESEFLDHSEEPEIPLFKVNEHVVEHEAGIDVIEVDGEMVKDEPEEAVERVEVQFRESDGDREQVITGDITNEIASNISIWEIQILEKIESTGYYQMLSLLDLVGSQDMELTSSNAYDNVMDAYSHFRDEQREDQALIADQMFDEDAEEVNMRVDDDTSKKVEVSGIDEESTGEPIKSKQSLLLARENFIWIAIFSSLLTLFLARFYFKCKRASAMTNVKCSEEKSCSALPTKVFKNIEQIQKVDSHINHSSIGHTISGAPMVELLGELVFGDAGSSIKGCGKKASSRSVSKGRRWLMSRAHSRSTYVQASPLECSTMDSPPYGSSTSHEKIAEMEVSSLCH